MSDQELRDFIISDLGMNPTSGAQRTTPELLVQHQRHVLNKHGLGLDTPNSSSIPDRLAILEEASANIMHYGAAGGGIINDRDAFVAAAATGNPVLVPEGTFYFSGASLSGLSNPVFIGAGSGKTTIILDSGNYFLDPATATLTMFLKGIKFQGGAGAFRNSWIGANVNGHKVIHDCVFRDYTVCAVSSNATDEPYWNFYSCQFRGLVNSDNIGVALAGSADSSIFQSCSFLTNRVDVKLRRSTRANFIGCDFLPYELGDSRTRCAVWLVPRTDDNSKGTTFTDCKFSNENITANDYQVLIADELDSAALVGDTLFDLSTDSTKISSGHQFVACDLQGSSGAAPPLVYSTTPNLRNISIGPLKVGGTPPTYIVQFKSALTADRLNQDSVIGPIIGSDTLGTEQTAIKPSNVFGWAKLNDPQGILSTENHPQAFFASDATGYVKVLPTKIRSFTLSNCTTSNITDALGGIDAAELTFTTTSGQAIASLTTANITPGLPLWVEFDVMAGASSPVASVKVDFQYTGNGATHWRKFKTVPTSGSWRRKRYLLIPREATTTIFMGFKAVTTGSIKLGRVRVYHADEPIFETLSLPDPITTTSAPSAGGGSALPATPTGYVTVNIGGTARQIAYY